MDGTQTPDNRPVEGGQNQPQPGVTITPGVSASPVPTSSMPSQPGPELPAIQEAAPTPAMSLISDPTTTPPISSANTDQSFTTGSLVIKGITNADQSQAPDSSALISWTASEFIAHNKSIEWYGILLGVSLVLAAALWPLTGDLFYSMVVVIAGGILAAYAARKPRELRYAVYEQGVMVGAKQYPFSGFQSFSITRDPGSPFSSIEFMPLKRFALPLTIYYAPTDEERIANAIAGQVPYEERKRDPIDSLMHRINF